MWTHTKLNCLSRKRVEYSAIVNLEREREREREEGNKNKKTKEREGR